MLPEQRIERKPPEKVVEDAWCDHDDVDDTVDCDDDDLYEIWEMVGYVCGKHKDAYVREGKNDPQ